jgi:hypothetical protein
MYAMLVSKALIEHRSRWKWVEGATTNRRLKRMWDSAWKSENSPDQSK